MLVDAAERAPDREALVCGDVHLTYAGFLSCVAAFAHELQALGAAGQRVAVNSGQLAGNRDRDVRDPCGRRTGGAAQPDLQRPRTDGPLVRLAPVIVLCEAARLTSIEPMAVRLEFVSVSALGLAASFSSVPTLGKAGSTCPRFQIQVILATLQYTGGTSGRPKGVNSLHGPMSVNVAQWEGVVTTIEGERVLCVMPLFHVYYVDRALSVGLRARHAGHPAEVSAGHPAGIRSWRSGLHFFREAPRCSPA